jgi:hypothetical protein
MEQTTVYFPAPNVYASRNLTINFAASTIQLAPGTYTLYIDLMEANILGKYGSGEKRATVQATLTITT